MMIYHCVGEQIISNKISMTTKGGGYVMVVYTTPTFSIVDNRLVMKKTNRFRLRYGTLAQHS